MLYGLWPSSTCENVDILLHFSSISPGAYSTVICFLFHYCMVRTVFKSPTWHQFRLSWHSASGLAARCWPLAGPQAAGRAGLRSADTGRLNRPASKGRVRGLFPASLRLAHDVPLRFPRFSSHHSTSHQFSSSVLSLVRSLYSHKTRWSPLEQSFDEFSALQPHYCSLSRQSTVRFVVLSVPYVIPFVLSFVRSYSTFLEQPFCPLVRRHVVASLLWRKLALVTQHEISLSQKDKV